MEPRKKPANPSSATPAFFLIGVRIATVGVEEVCVERVVSVVVVAVREKEQLLREKGRHFGRRYHPVGNLRYTRQSVTSKVSTGASKSLYQARPRTVACYTRQPLECLTPDNLWASLPSGKPDIRFM